MNNPINLKITEIHDNKRVSFNLEQNETFYYKKYLDKQNKNISDTIIKPSNNILQNNNQTIHPIPFISNTNYKKNNKVFTMKIMNSTYNTKYNNINKKLHTPFTMNFIK